MSGVWAAQASLFSQVQNVAEMRRALLSRK